jgi:hypothetical protein
VRLLPSDSNADRHLADTIQNTALRFGFPYKFSSSFSLIGFIVPKEGERRNRLRFFHSHRYLSLL